MRGWYMYVCIQCRHYTVLWLFNGVKTLSTNFLVKKIRQVFSFSERILLRRELRLILGMTATSLSWYISTPVNTEYTDLVTLHISTLIQMDTFDSDITWSWGYPWIGIDSLKQLSKLDAKFKFTATMQFQYNIASD